MSTAMALPSPVARTLTAMNPGLPLIEAVRADEVANVGLLLAGGADPNTVDDSRVGEALITIAAENGSAEVVRLLLDAGANNSPVNGSDWTPLRAAIYEGHADVVSVLLTHGVDPNPPHERGSMLSEAIDATRHGPSPGSMRVLELLLQAGATMRPGESPAIISAVEYGSSPAALRLLISHRHDPDELRDDGTPPIILATRRGDHAGVDALIAGGANVDVTDLAGRSPLMHPAELGHERIVASLLQAGADRDHADRDGTTALLLAKSWLRGSLQSMLGERAVRRERVDARRTIMELRPRMFELRGSPSHFDLWARVIDHTIDDLGEAKFRTIVGEVVDGARELAERLRTERALAIEPEGWHLLEVSAQDVSIVRSCLLNLAYGPKMEMPAGLNQTDVRDLFEELMSQLDR